MADITVTFSDGKSHVYQGVPDDASPSQVQERVARDFPGQQATHIDRKAGESEGFLSQVGSAVKRTAASAVAGLGKSAAAVPRAVSMAITGGIAPEASQSLDEMGDSVEKYWTEFGNKNGLNNKYGKAVAEGVGGAASAPTNLPGLIAGGGAGAGSELSANLFGDSFVSRLLGGLVGGGASAAAASKVGNRLTPQAATLAKESLEGISPKMLSDAEAFQKASLAKGIQIDLAQALEAVGAPASNLTTIRNFLASKKQGDQVQQVLRDQPGQLSLEASQFAARLPGENYGTAQAANNLQQAATSRIQLAQQQRSKVWQDTLDNVKSALESVAQSKRLLASQNLSQVQAGTSAAESAAQQQVVAATARLKQLQDLLEKAKSGDATAVAKANAAVAESRKLVESLQSFSFPRGQVTTPRGSFLSEPRRGESIVNDQITRELQANSLENTIPPQVADAPSLPTMQAQKAVETGAQELSAAEQAAAALKAQNAKTVGAAQDALTSAENAAKSVSFVPEQAVQRARTRLFELADKYPNTAQGNMLRDLASRMKTQDGFVTDPNALNLILREASAKLKDPTIRASGIDKGAAKAIGDAIGEARDNFGNTFKPLKAANTAYSNFTTEVIDPLKQGPVGQFAGKGYDPAVQAGMTKFESLMKDGVDANAKNSSVRVLARELAQVDPNAVPDALKSYVSKNIQKAMEPGATSQTAANNADMASRIADNLFANEMQAQGLRDAVAESAKSLGQNSSEMVKGLNNFMQITRALKSRPATVGGLAQKEIFEIGGRTMGADALRVFGFLPFERVARRLEDTVLGSTLKKFDTILTSPDGAKLLVELGKVDPTSKRAAMIISTMAGTSATNPVGVTGE